MPLHILPPLHTTTCRLCCLTPVVPHPQAEAWAEVRVEEWQKKAKAAVAAVEAARVQSLVKVVVATAAAANRAVLQLLRRASRSLGGNSDLDPVGSADGGIFLLRQSMVRLSAAFAPSCRRLQVGLAPTAVDPQGWRPYLSSPVYPSGQRLRQHQLEGLNWLLRNWYSARGSVIAEGRGLGSKVELLAMLEHVYAVEGIAQPTLLVAPRHRLAAWRSRAQHWTRLRVRLYADEGGEVGRASLRQWAWGDASLGPQPSGFDLLLTTPEILLEDRALLSPLVWHCLVVDGGGLITPWDSLLSTCLRELRSRSRILLTDLTHLPLQLQALWTVFGFVSPATFPSMKHFNNRFSPLHSQPQLQALQSAIVPFLLKRSTEAAKASAAAAAGRAGAKVGPSGNDKDGPFFCDGLGEELAYEGVPEDVLEVAMTKGQVRGAPASLWHAQRCHWRCHSIVLCCVSCSAVVQCLHPASFFPCPLQKAAYRQVYRRWLPLLQELGVGGGSNGDAMSLSAEQRSRLLQMESELLLCCQHPWLLPGGRPAQGGAPLLEDMRALSGKFKALDGIVNPEQQRSSGVCTVVCCQSTATLQLLQVLTPSSPSPLPPAPLLLPFPRALGCLHPPPFHPFFFCPIPTARSTYSCRASACWLWAPTAAPMNGRRPTSPSFSQPLRPRRLPLPPLPLSSPLPVQPTVLELRPAVEATLQWRLPPGPRRSGPLPWCCCCPVPSCFRSPSMFLCGWQESSCAQPGARSSTAVRTGGSRRC